MVELSRYRASTEAGLESERFATYRARVVRVIAGGARDAADARRLLDMLGLAAQEGSGATGDPTRES